MSRKLKFIVPALAFMWLAGKIIQISTTSARAADPALTFAVDEDGESAKQPLFAALKVLDTNEPSFLKKFNDTIRSRFQRRQFADLDAYAAEQRQLKVRLPDGSWLLTRLYEALSVPNDVKSSDAEYLAQFRLLEDWIAERPDSVTARVAYAEGWIGYAAHATESNVLRQRLVKAEGLLTEASNIGIKCPHYFSTMLTLAYLEGWPRHDFEHLQKKAVAYERFYPPLNVVFQQRP